MSPLELSDLRELFRDYCEILISEYSVDPDKSPLCQRVKAFLAAESAKHGLRPRESAGADEP